MTGLPGGIAEMASLLSLLFLTVFFPLCLLVFQITPKKAKPVVLLLESLLFYTLANGILLFFLLVSIAGTWLFGLALDRLAEKHTARVKETPKEERKALKKRLLRRRRWLLFVSSFWNVGLLVFLKYTPFFLQNLFSLASLLGFSVDAALPRFLQPLGLSFFTLSAFSYLFDVYRGTVKADRNPLRLALFLSFFPQIIEGPICRYGETAAQLWSVCRIKYENLVPGLRRILFGLMKKLVVADRLNLLVKTVFDDYATLPGGAVALGALFYTVQLYMDFSGAMDAVVGIGQIFGIKMPENFARPFFSVSVSEFWTRWHISLGAFFRDYIFYPLSMSKPLKKLTAKVRPALGDHFGPLLAGGAALLCVWVCNGLWHGAAWSFLFFGMYHFVLILLGEIVTPFSAALLKRLGIGPENRLLRLFRILRTGLLVVIGELFFRANGLRAGLAMFSKMVTDFSFTLPKGSLLSKLRVDPQDLLIVFVTLAIVFAVGLLREKKIDVNGALGRRRLPVRFGVMYALILYIVIFGAYGPGYVPVDPMYANF